jgi:hypothetical protein
MTLVITSCTNRKKHTPTDDLCVSHLNRGTLEQTVCQWVDTINAQENQYASQDLYIGRSIKETQAAAHLLSTEPYIISAGMGLIKSSDNIPSYDLTIQTGTASTIQSKIVEPIFPYEWWSELNKKLNKKNPIANLINAHPNEIVLIACAEVYIKLIEKDLETLSLENLNRIRIFGPQHPKKFPQSIQNIIMPYDQRFDGPDGPIRGTRTDFAQRALLHFSKEIWINEPYPDALENHYALVNNLMNKMRKPEIVKRIVLNDNEIIELVPKMWARAKGKSGRMLRVLRDQELVACEQQRFSNLFKKAKERFSL